jgi:voltage-gated potassium channel
MARLEPGGPPGSRRSLTFHVIFETETRSGRAFDVALLVAILASVLAVLMESVAPFAARYGPGLRRLEWVFTVLFTIEYALRVWSVSRPRSYTLSFFGLIDLLAVIPTYLSVIVPGGQVLAVVRVLRVLRVFRVLKLTRYMGEASVLGAALRAARYKISVFLVTVFGIVIIVGAVMYLVEGPASGFTSIPMGVYWAIVTLTTVGFGDITPVTTLGQTIASFVMILGYGIIAVPTGIVTAEIVAQGRGPDVGYRVCTTCRHQERDPEALYCRRCGERLP